MYNVNNISLLISALTLFIIAILLLFAQIHPQVGTFCRLKETLDDVTRDPDDKEEWRTTVLSFGKRYLQPPRRGRKRHNLTAIIRNRLNRDECEEDAPEPLVRRKQRNADDATVMVAAASSNRRRQHQGGNQDTDIGR